jgi:MYXO-CTERM domain-containing protein
VTTPVSLFVMGEGRYEATNMPDFTIYPDQLVWDWDTMSSNYAMLKKTTFDASQGKAWLVEAGEPFSPYSLQDTLTSLAQYDPINSGYADELGAGAPEAALADVTTLIGTLDPASVWITRLHGELSRQALGTDLTLAASDDQTPVVRYLQATKTTGTAPTCPVYPPCQDSSGGSESGGSGGAGGFTSGGWDAASNVKKGQSFGGCAMTPEGNVPSVFGALGVLAALAFARRRRAR